MPLPPRPDPTARALLLLLLLARDAGLEADQVDSPDARALVAGGLRHADEAGAAHGRAGAVRRGCLGRGVGSTPGGVLHGLPACRRRPA